MLVRNGGQVGETGRLTVTDTWRCTFSSPWPAIRLVASATAQRGSSRLRRIACKILAGGINHLPDVSLHLHAHLWPAFSSYDKFCREMRHPPFHFLHLHAHLWPAFSSYDKSWREMRHPPFHFLHLHAHLCLLSAPMTNFAGGTRLPENWPGSGYRRGEARIYPAKEPKIGPKSRKHPPIGPNPRLGCAETRPVA
jgi:hypothetical protein